MRPALERNIPVERSYRRRARPSRMVSFQVRVKQTDLWISATSVLEKEARDLVLECRHSIEAYISSHPEFSTTLSPWPEDPWAPDIVRKMIQASRLAGTGPMAAVAGAVASFVGEGLSKKTEEVIVENGGDVYLKTVRSVTVALYAGDSPLSGKVGIRVSADRTPLGVCSSSGKVGHSLSLGWSDAACLLSRSTALADAVATAAGNRIRGPSGLERAAEWARAVEGITGGVLITGKKLASWGEVELVPL